MYVTGGLPVNFNYVAFSGVTNLFVAALIYDVTSGLPVFNSKVTMVNQQAGVYEGSFTPQNGHSYLIIKNVYTDGTYSVVSLNWSTGADNYDAFVTDTSLLNFNYATFDVNAGLTIRATVYNLTDVINNSFNMTHVANGAYFGQFQGVLNKNYLVTEIPTDSFHTPDSDSFQSRSLTPVYTVLSPPSLLFGQGQNAQLIAPQLNAQLVGT